MNIQFITIIIGLLTFSIVISSNHFTHSNSYEPSSSSSSSSSSNAKDILQGFVQSHLISTGTTIVGLCCQDGIVLGADTRSTGGPLVMDKNKLKIHRLSSKILCCAAGTSAVCDHLSRKVRNRLALEKIGIYQRFQQQESKEWVNDNDNENDEDDGRNTMVNIAVHYISEELQQMMTKSDDSDDEKEEDSPKAVFIVGGIDSDGAKLYQIEYETVPCRIAYGSLGSGSTDALAILESSLQDKTEEMDLDHPIANVSVEEGIQIVRKAVQAGILNDLGSGSHVDLCVITKDGTRRWREKSLSSSPLSSERQRVTASLPDKDSKRGHLLEDSNHLLGKRIWTPRTTRLIYENDELHEHILPIYDDHVPITIELLPDE